MGAGAAVWYFAPELIDEWAPKIVSESPNYRPKSKQEVKKVTPVQLASEHLNKGELDDAWRIATPNTPIPYSPPLEDVFLPGTERIVVEPDARNHKIHVLNQRVGFRPSGLVTLAWSYLFDQ